ncbi:hypothetical protein [Fusobacterium sp. SYSU M8D902]|uniref:hypothetical protein n=1 Tax=Fusobacterium sp. SYSU M8D902 TaxID=3159562 RepID=UPI0032E3A3A7
MQKNKIYTIQPISVEIEGIIFYQDEKIKVLEVKVDKTKLLRINTSEILEMPTIAIKTIIE